MNTKIKRLSFNINIPEGYSSDNYISDKIDTMLESNKIWCGNVLNIIETEKDGIYSIIIYYKKEMN